MLLDLLPPLLPLGPLGRAPSFWRRQLGILLLVVEVLPLQWVILRGAFLVLFLLFSVYAESALLYENTGGVTAC